MKSMLDKIILFLSALLCGRCCKELLSIVTHSFSIIPIHVGTDMWMLELKN